jgi:hypothetical protein
MFAIHVHNFTCVTNTLCLDHHSMTDQSTLLDSYKLEAINLEDPQPDIKQTYQTFWYQLHLCSGKVRINTK